MPEFKAAQNVMLYLPIGGEADVTGIICGGKSFYVPVTEGVKITPALYRADTELTGGEYGVRVPLRPQLADKRSLDFVVVPAVAADKSKNRMGFGKGCYDRFLAGTSCVKAAACFSFQLTQALEKKPFDITMDYIVTEDGVF